MNAHPSSLSVAPIDLAAIEPAIFDALVSWHEIGGIPADPVDLGRLATYLTAAVIESPPAAFVTETEAK